MRGIDRRNPLRAVKALYLAARGVGRAREILRAREADAVMGGGGYVAAPAGIAAVRMKLPLVLAEADSHLGLANRLLASRARRVCLAFPIAGREGERYLVTGRPVPAAIAAADRGAARKRFGIAPADPCLLVFGGSLGARTINLAAAEAFGTGPAADPERVFHVLHLSGTRDHAELAERLAGATRYTLLPYEPGLADSLAASDLALARSGGSVFELTAAGRPAVLVPYPYASARHQHTNAEWMRDAGAAVMVEDAELTPDRMRAEVEPLLADPGRLAEMSAASAGLAKADAARVIAEEILATVATATDAGR